MLFVQARSASRLASKRVASHKRAIDQHISWIRQSDKKAEASKVLKSLNTVDPLIRSKSADIKTLFEFEGSHKPRRDQTESANTPDIDSQDLRAILQPTFRNEIGCIELGPFGRISATHGDIFDQPGSLCVFPIPSNLMPYRGLALSALERGGDALLRELFSTARSMYSEHIISPTSDGNAESMKQRQPSTRGLPIGSVIPVGNSLFVAVPYYWQGSASDANQRLRYTIRSVVDYAVRAGDNVCKRIVIPHIGRGVFGYEAEWSTEALVEEAIEGLLQLDKRDVKKSNIEEIAFIDNDMETASEFKEAIETLADRWLPERRLTTAPQFYSRATRRLIVMDEKSELSTMRRRDKYKFKQYHGKLRNRGGRYFRETIQPWIWRTQKVLEPPPLLVNEKTGAIGDKQLPARPYYFRGLSHTLFPVNLRTGFPSLRRGRNGQLVGVNRQPDTQKIAKPRT